ncbi:ATP-dependent helicase, partial [Streptomyces sp. SID2131]|nr:ATP-dependent helicase [Streptomyces sp. SID2131]
MRNALSLSHGPDDSTREPARTLSRHSAVFLPADPPRAGRIAFWSPDGEPLPDSPGVPAAAAELTVVDGDTLRPVTVPARTLSVRDALPLLVRARSSDTASPAAAFWGAAALLALDLVARGLLLPGLTPGDHDAWRAGPLGPEE